MTQTPLIETKSVSKRFNDFTAVDGVSFSVAEGQAVGVIGPNGAGKTTFFNLLTGLFPPSAGSVFFEERDITQMPSHERTTSGIVRTFQLVSVFDSLRVIENIALAVVRFGRNYTSPGRFLFSNARQKEVVDACMEALETMGIGDKAQSLTAGLSYGDKRKLEIAMALGLRPRILLLDEPFAGLGDIEISEVLGIIEKVKSKLTLVIIEHKISQIINLVERLCVIHEGRLIAEGEPRSVLQEPMVREVYFGKEEGLVCSV
jgi:branched-chain amino acid transport system ATP-binding protein